MGDVSKHISYFKVENFKRFQSFEMKDIGQFNLIVGDNNVGKTSVLEALLINDDSRISINNFAKALRLRNLKTGYNYQDIELYANKDRSIDNGQVSILFKCEYRDRLKDSIDLVIDKKSGIVFFTGIKDDHRDHKFNFYDPLFESSFYKFPYIPFYVGYKDDLAAFYSRLQESKSLKNSFLKKLKTLIPDIDNIELSSPYATEKPYLIIYQQNVNYSLPLAVFGDGALKLFRLLAEIVLNKGGRLMIDEIDTGIHFSRFKEFWLTLLRAAKESDVQLFMTTHNEECIRYFVEVLSSNDMKSFQQDARNISLIELPDKSVKAYTYPFDHLEANISVGNEIRGGSK